MYNSSSCQLYSLGEDEAFSEAASPAANIVTVDNDAGPEEAEFLFDAERPGAGDSGSGRVTVNPAAVSSLASALPSAPPSSATSGLTSAQQHRAQEEGRVLVHPRSATAARIVASSPPAGVLGEQLDCSLTVNESPVSTCLQAHHVATTQPASSQLLLQQQQQQHQQKQQQLSDTQQGQQAPALLRCQGSSRISWLNGAQDNENSHCRRSGCNAGRNGAFGVSGSGGGNGGSSSGTKKYSGPLPYRPRRTKVDKSDHHCKICDKYYSNRKQLRKHINSFHSEEPFEITSKNLNLDRVNWCLEDGCHFRHDRNHVFTKHLEEKHQILTERIERHFSSFADYEKWKVELEESRKIKFVAGDGYYWRLTKEGRRVSRQHLFCHKAKEFNTVGKKVAFRMEGHIEDEIERLVKPTWNKITESLAKETLARKNNSMEEATENLGAAVDEMEVIRRLVPAKQNLIKMARTNSKGGCFLFSQCTAYLHVTIFEHDHSVHVEGCLSHYGHEPVVEHDIFDLPESVVAKLKQHFVRGHSLDEVTRFAANTWPQFRLKAGTLEGIRDRNLRRILFKQYYAQFTNIFERVVDISRTINQFYFVEPNDILVVLLDIEHTLHDLHKQLVKKVNATMYPNQNYQPDKVLRDSPVDLQQVLECLAMQQNFSHFKRLVRYAEHHKAFYMNHKVTKENLWNVSEFDMALADENYRCFELDDDEQKRSADEQLRRKRRNETIDDAPSPLSVDKGPLRAAASLGQVVSPDREVQRSQHASSSVLTSINGSVAGETLTMSAPAHMNLTQCPINQQPTNSINPTSLSTHQDPCDVRIVGGPNLDTFEEPRRPTEQQRRKPFGEFLRHATEAQRHDEDGEDEDGLRERTLLDSEKQHADQAACLPHEVSFPAEDESLTLSNLPEFLPKSPPSTGATVLRTGAIPKLTGPLADSIAPPVGSSVATPGVDLGSYLALGAAFGAADSDSEVGHDGALMLNFDHLFGPGTPQS